MRSHARALDRSGTFVNPRSSSFNASTLDAVRWVMTVGKNYSRIVPASFDLGVDGVPLALSNRGNLTLALQWGVQVRSA